MISRTKYIWLVMLVTTECDIPVEAYSTEAAAEAHMNRGRDPLTGGSFWVRAIELHD